MPRGRASARNVALAALILALCPRGFTAAQESATAVASSPTAAAAGSPRLQELYGKAFQSYSTGEYQKAVLEWEGILQEYPDQASARDMIAKARHVIWRLTRKKQEEIQLLVRRGQYQKALVSLQPLLDLDPDDPRLKSFRQRLQNVVELVPVLDKRDGATRAVVTGLGAFLAFDPDYQLAYDAMRYALEKKTDDDLFKKLSDVVVNEEPELVKDEVTPGMTLIAYKQHTALSDIYDGRYPGAIKILQEVTALEPENLKAMERLGSAYYCLGLKAQAKQAWEDALKISPNDPGLKRSLSGRKPLKCGSRK